MKQRRAFLVVTLTGMALLGPAAPLLAQGTAPGKELETVIVTGRRVPDTPDAVAHDVIRSMAAPSLLLGTIGRWQGALCPRTDGLSSRTSNNFVTRRIREVAALVGAPLADEPCKSNVEILFTDQPQDALDAVRQTNSDVLGYHPATSISHPVQAWYVSGTVDVRGQLQVDRDVQGSIEFNNGGPQIDPRTGYYASGTVVTTFGIPQANIEGWKFKPEVSSSLLGAFIIADSRQTGNLQLGPVADYIALLTLARTEAYDRCQIVASIANLLAPNCDARLKAEQLTAADLGYLRGIYKMDPGASLQIQQDQIAGEMAKALVVKSGP